MTQSSLPSKSREAGYELGDLSANAIALFAALLTFLIALVLSVTFALYRHFADVQRKNQPASSPLSFSPKPTPETQLVARPGADLKTLRAAEETLLHSYGWVDRDKGQVRIPIELAMEIVASNGLPVLSGKEEKSAGEKSRDSRDPGQREARRERSKDSE